MVNNEGATLLANLLENWSEQFTFNFVYMISRLSHVVMWGQELGQYVNLKYFGSQIFCKIIMKLAKEIIFFYWYPCHVWKLFLFVAREWVSFLCVTLLKHVNKQEITILLILMQLGQNFCFYFIIYFWREFKHFTLIYMAVFVLCNDRMFTRLLFHDLKTIDQPEAFFG